jgi:hypothetical protein
MELTYDQKYYRDVRRFRPRVSRRQDPGKKCEFCSIPLVSRFGGKLRKKYCDDCMKSPRISRLIYNLYQKRAYRKRKGLPVPEINPRRLVR